MLLLFLRLYIIMWNDSLSDIDNYIVFKIFILS